MAKNCCDFIAEKFLFGNFAVQAHDMILADKKEQKVASCVNQGEDARGGKLFQRLVLYKFQEAILSYHITINIDWCWAILSTPRVYCDTQSVS